ncbi:uncharacterized protein LY89DRAFT_689500 [Mollisia scopiformis]|uniref:Uncharacterized protein n=1 Tax=Mollisia scopiformis TaxID=149040 RepID=A0A194WTH6_MOLSC|nr:uncharacterized protein LY89DRAFT_689500 [Mollisia scopiformis]KUJ10974.1 hypothetical protein LY89DRAFT_689500 [Mollisia scopiformis]
MLYFHTGGDRTRLPSGGLVDGTSMSKAGGENFSVDTCCIDKSSSAELSGADGGLFAQKVLPFQMGPTEYTGKKTVVVPRCCQVKEGSQHCQR